MGGNAIFQISVAVLVAFLLVVCLFQAAGVWQYVRRVYEAADRPVPTVSRWPRICVYVPVRGGGPTWRGALEHLLSLDYPDFEVFVVVDHPTDPATEVITSLIQERQDGRLRMEFLRDPSPHRSLYCSGLVQFFEQLDPSCELVAFCGADMHLPRSFFREMAAPMLAAEVGCTLGNRWYRPQMGSLGSIVRYSWNSGAVVPMWTSQIPWGGAAVLRPADIRRSGLLQAWSKGMVEDAPIRAAMQRLGLQLIFVPKLLVIHDDEIDLGPCREFIKRQLLWTRLYHPHWSFVVLHAILGTAAVYAPWLLAMFAIGVGHYAMATVLALTGFLYWCCQALLGAILEQAARKIAAANGQPLPRMKWSLMAKIFLAIPLTQLLFAMAVVSCTWLKRVQWSGIEYEIRDSYDVRLVQYHPVA